MTRRKLLLWGIPAVLGLAVVAGLLALALLPSDAKRAIKQIQVGMTIEQVADVIGPRVTRVPGLSSRFASSAGPDWALWYPDDSLLFVVFDSNRRVRATEWKWARGGQSFLARTHR